MTTKVKVIIALVALTTAFAFGRYSAPESVKTDKESSENSDTNKKKKTVVTEKEKPDGSKEKKTVVTEESSKSKSKTEKESEEVTRTSSRVSISVLAGLDVSSVSVPHYGAAISRPILGPITLGAFYLSPGVVGASLGLTF